MTDDFVRDWTFRTLDCSNPLGPPPTVCLCACEILIGGSTGTLGIIQVILIGLDSPEFLKKNRSLDC